MIAIKMTITALPINTNVKLDITVLMTNESHPVTNINQADTLVTSYGRVATCKFTTWRRYNGLLTKVLLSIFYTNFLIVLETFFLSKSKVGALCRKHFVRCNSPLLCLISLMFY